MKSREREPEGMKPYLAKQYPAPIKPAGWDPPVVAVIGMGAGAENVGESIREWIERAQVLVGSPRHLEYFPDHTGEKIPFGAPLSAQMELLGEISKTRRTAVLASGDPLFFGIGKRLGEKFGRDRLIVVPNVSNLQVLCARIGEPWGDIETVSLHGREGAAEAAMSRITGALSMGCMVAVFTDPAHTPGWIAKSLAQSGFQNCTMIVGEEIGSQNERIREFNPAGAENADFSDLNLVLIRPAEGKESRLTLRVHEGLAVLTSKDIAAQGKESPLPLREGQGEGGLSTASGPLFGFPETSFERDAGMITKMEIRAVALALLSLEPGLILWDVGAGSGSVSIEAARLVPGMKIFAIEKNELRYRQMLENIKVFGTSAVAAINESAPEAFIDLPAPDRVFIGGGGPALPQILETVARRLAPGGGVIQTIVLLDTLEKAKNFWMGRNFDVTLTQLQVSRSAPLGKDLRLEALNPVFIVSAWRK